MPLYDAECSNCGIVVEFSASPDDCLKTPPCPDCGGVTTRVFLRPPMAIVKFPAAGGHEYISPVSGKPITTERARREDMKRHDCRPYEGFQQEAKEAKRRVAEDEKKSDAKLDDNVRKAYHQLSPEKRRHLGG